MQILNYQFFGNLLFSQSMNPKKICKVGLNVRAGKGTVHLFCNRESMYMYIPKVSL